MDNDQFSSILPFLLRAKRATYASSDEAVQIASAQQPSSRPGSHDLAYREGDLFYLDTYLGGFSFAGEEAVWRAGIPLWSMNYYGSMLIEAMPEGFSHFLKVCLRELPPEAPYRGPKRLASGLFSYKCRWKGKFEAFLGEESISMADSVIYRLFFHGGIIR